MATAFLPGLLSLRVRGRRNDSAAAKRARDGDVLLSEEADARGWSSSVPERSLALRRRHGAASGTFTRGCGWVAAATADDLGCRRDKAAETPDSIGSGTRHEGTEIEPSCFTTFFSISGADLVTELEEAEMDDPFMSVFGRCLNTVNL